MKKFAKILSLVIFLCCITALFAACKDNDNDKDFNIKSGTYYSVDIEDSYVVINNETITFHNIDFSGIEQIIFNIYEEQVDVSEILSGAQTYTKATGAPIIYVDIESYGLALMFDYDSGENVLKYGKAKYVLQEP